LVRAEGEEGKAGKMVPLDGGIGVAEQSHAGNGRDGAANGVSVSHADGKNAADADADVTMGLENMDGGGGAADAGNMNMNRDVSMAMDLGEAFEEATDGRNAAPSADLSGIADAFL